METETETSAVYPVILLDGNRYSIVHTERLRDFHGLERYAGHLRKATEEHAGMWVYPFSSRVRAEDALERMTRGTR